MYIVLAIPHFLCKQGVNVGNKNIIYFIVYNSLRYVAYYPSGNTSGYV